MASFVIIARDTPGSTALRAGTRADHLVHLEALGADVRLAGPVLDDEGQAIGSLIVADFADKAAAEAFAAGDPYARAGLFASVEVLPWRQALPAM